jgi:hypothetical protein
MRPGLAALALAFSLPVALSACSKPKTYTTQVVVEQVQTFGSASGGMPSLMDLDIKFVDCPGNQHRIMRGDKAFSACGGKIKKGDKLTAEILFTYAAERDQYRSEVVKLGDCPVKLDPKDEANYEMVQTCTDLTASGATVGVHCDRTRNKALVEKCPWYKRK